MNGAVVDLFKHRLIVNKAYLYAGTIHKIKKIYKNKNLVVLVSLIDQSEVEIPFTGGEILLSRVYTIGEVAKIVERRSDTIRKYERNGFLPKPSIDTSQYESYKSWRFYSLDDLYQIMAFFEDRVPGRPAKTIVDKSTVNKKIENLSSRLDIVSSNTK